MKVSSWLLAVALLLITTASSAAKINSIAVTQNNDQYFMDVQTSINHPAALLWQALASPENFEKLNDSIQSVVIYPPQKKQSYLRVFSKIKACVAVFCVTPKVNMDFYDRSKLGENHMQAVAVPKKGNFKTMTANWLVSSSGENSSSLNFTVDVTPDFWVPPLIGPWMIKRKMREEALETLVEIEKLILANDRT